MQLKRTSRNYNHSNTFYLNIIKGLIKARRNSLTYSATADLLNAEGLTTHTGLPWSEDIIRNTFKKLRNKKYAGKLYQAMLTLIYREELSLKDSLVLFTPSNKRAINDN